MFYKALILPDGNLIIEFEESSGNVLKRPRATSVNWQPPNTDWFRENASTIRRFGLMASMAALGLVSVIPFGRDSFAKCAVETKAECKVFEYCSALQPTPSPSVPFYPSVPMVPSTSPRPPLAQVVVNSTAAAVNAVLANVTNSTNTTRP
jgi:hypothetical protein